MRCKHWAYDSSPPIFCSRARAKLSNSPIEGIPENPARCSSFGHSMRHMVGFGCASFLFPQRSRKGFASLLLCGFPCRALARISHGLSTAAAHPGMSTALRSVGLLDVLSSTSAGPSVARLVSTPVCAASPRNPVRNAG